MTATELARKVSHVIVFLAAMLIASTSPVDATSARVIAAYADGAAAAYRDSAASAGVLRDAVRELCARPDEARLAAARDAWRAARVAYGKTEAYRFGGGPIDSRRGGVETFVNAWPVDESCIEPADGAARTGIIRDRARYPVLARAALRELNQRGGETNVCTGWHAIEFMLWGQDRSDTGPGARQAGDFKDGAAADADRRREFLLEITQLLCDDLSGVAAAWAPGEGSHRSRLVADERWALRAMFTGTALLTGFEMAGERLAVALETRDQEEEHSCFSDTTDADFKANVRGVERVLRGWSGGPGLIDLVRTTDPQRADSMAAALDAAAQAVDAIPAPFDAAMRADDGSPPREALRRAMQSLERLGEEISRGAKALGIDLPTEPQG
jgi:putative iron-regulated protein